MSIHVLYWIAFCIEMICLPACINIDARRAYGRIFGTSINTTIYHNIFYFCATFVIVVFIFMQLGVF